MKPNMLEISFILDRVNIQWQEVVWGYKHGYLNWSEIVRLAEIKLQQGREKPLEIELASLGKEEVWRVRELVDKLSRNEMDTISTDRIKKKWLYLVLAWVYENRKEISDPLGKVEEVYADFDYPEEIEQFVRYMPIEKDQYNPSDHSKEENEKRLFYKWNEYLNNFIEP
jgi:hypothetical protein